MLHARTRHTYNTHYSAHKRLIFTAKPPTLCTCTYIHTIYIRSGERTINLHFIELKRWRDRSLYTQWHLCYYGVILLNRNRLSRNLSTVGPSAGVRIRLLRRRRDHVIPKLQSVPNTLVGFGWANIAQQIICIILYCHCYNRHYTAYCLIFWLTFELHNIYINYMYARLRGTVHVIIAIIAILAALAYVWNIVYIYIPVVYIYRYV